MVGNKYLKLVSTQYPYEYEKPSTAFVSLWDFSECNLNEEARLETICVVASISYGNDSCRNPLKLWDKLVSLGHESPFEFIKTVENDRVLNFRESVFGYSRPNLLKESVATFKIKIPIFVARQIIRHRTFSYLEMSRRYVKDDKVPFEFWKGIEEFTEEELRFYEKAWELYKNLIQRGIKPEKARSVLPVSLYTVLWMQGDYRAFTNFFIHRLHKTAQEETRLVAESMFEQLVKYQQPFVKKMLKYLNEYPEECNPLFRQSRIDKAKWFRKYIKGRIG